MVKKCQYHIQKLTYGICDTGYGNFIGAFANVGPNSHIANYCIVNTLANIEHEVSIADFSQLGPGSTVCGRSSIDENVFIGAGSKIINGISISSDVTIGAGAVVSMNITEPNTKYVGVLRERYDLYFHWWFWRKISETTLDFIDEGISGIELSGGIYDAEVKTKLLSLKSAVSFQVHNYFPPPEKPFVLNLATLNKKKHQLA